MAGLDALNAESSLVKKYSRVISVETPREAGEGEGVEGGRWVYEGVRVFYREHPKKERLPPNLPLVVFVHGELPWGVSAGCGRGADGEDTGLGGQVQQFQYVIDYFVGTGFDTKTSKN